MRTHLPLSADDDDVTVECVAYNLVGKSHGIFVHRKCHRVKDQTDRRSAPSPPVSMTPAQINNVVI